MEMALRRLTAAEYETFNSRAVAGYTAEIAASGALPPDAAERKARQDHERLLPGGHETPGQLIFRLVAGREPVGWLWLAVPGEQGDPGMAWVNLVEVDEAFRGYGREAMLLAEAEARSRGMRSVGLNVHGSNVAARSLYTSLGYDVITQQMKKSL